MTGFLGAAQFLTRIPIRLPAPVAHARAVPWFPVVGALIGAGIGAVAAGMAHLVPVPVAGVTAVMVGLLITGAFHEDGLADVADAFGGGWTIERRLEILKDPRHGTYGVAALGGSIAIRVVCAASIVSPAALFATFVAAHTLGRAAAVAAMKVAPPAVESGLGVTAATSLRTSLAAIGIAAGVALTALVCGWWVAPFVGASVVAAGAVVALAIRKIGGLAGDVLGAAEQVVECLVMIVATGLAARHAIWWS
ncbi:MAG: adenosylcobinamide-GDP ribazoletransferase [Ilumatobacteraceae bacterium]